METQLTTVRLPLDLHEALRRRAFAERRPVAEIIREAIVAWLADARTAPSIPPLESDPLWGSVGSVPGGPPDESEHHDGYLYVDRVAETPVTKRPASPRRAKKGPARPKRPTKRSKPR